MLGGCGVGDMKSLFVLMVFLAQLQWVNPLSSHRALGMNGPLLSSRDLSLGWKHCGGTVGCVMPLPSWGTKCKALVPG